MLILAQEGIFPVTKDAEGQQLPLLPASGFSFPGTIQGEGKLNGIPSLFIRLAGCNLRCHWKTADQQIIECDTAHAAFKVKNTSSLTIEEICKIIYNNSQNINHIVITGGEPLLQAKDLAKLCRQLKHMRDFHITIETNATLYDEEVAKYVDFFSMSPKLATSIPPAPYTEKHDRLRICINSIQAFITHANKCNKDFQLKFVHSSNADITEIKSILEKLDGWKNEDILLMPLGATPAELQQNIPHTLLQCIQNGWRYCDRLHISLFGPKQGV